MPIAAPTPTPDPFLRAERHHLLHHREERLSFLWGHLHGEKRFPLFRRRLLSSDLPTRFLLPPRTLHREIEPLLSAPMVVTGGRQLDVLPIFESTRNLDRAPYCTHHSSGGLPRRSTRSSRAPLSSHSRGSSVCWPTTSQMMPASPQMSAGKERGRLALAKRASGGRYIRSVGVCAAGLRRSKGLVKITKASDDGRSSDFFPTHAEYTAQEGRPGDRGSPSNRTMNSDWGSPNLS